VGGYGTGGASGAGYGGGGGGARGGLNIDASPGNDGVVIIRYTGPAVASGGTITSSGGDTIHTFTTSGTLAVS
jgi:hypothetical protein